MKNERLNRGIFLTALTQVKIEDELGNIYCCKESYKMSDARRRIKILRRLGYYAEIDGSENRSFMDDEIVMLTIGAGKNSDLSQLPTVDILN